MIYERCLCYDGEIIPFPCSYEKEDAEKQELSQELPFGQPNDQGPFLGVPYSGLLGVNSTIRDEAATILFGKNIWRLSYAQNDKYPLWETYAKYFRHVVTWFHYRDFDPALLLDLTMGEMHVLDAEDSDHFDQTGTDNEHGEQLTFLIDGFISKKNILRQMNLRFLSFDFSNLYCSARCCRYKALQRCLECLGKGGPWYKVKPKRGGDSSTGPEIDKGQKEGETIVEILGLKDKTEKELVWKKWGLRVE